MARLNLDKKNKRLELTCDCGILHVIDLSSSEPKLNSFYNKQKKEEENGKKKKEQLGLFDELFDDDRDDTDFE